MGASGDATLAPAGLPAWFETFRVLQAADPAIRRRRTGPDRMAAQSASDRLPATCRRSIGPDRYGTAGGCTKYTRIDARRALPAAGPGAATIRKSGS